jgi:hypothetical protein
MTDKIDAFLNEVRTMPGFVAASASDPGWLTKLDVFERSLLAVDRLADDDPAILDIFDEIQTAAGRSDLFLKQRLLEVSRLLAKVRDAMKFTH